MEVLAKLVKYLSRRDFSHLEDVHIFHISDCNVLTRERKCFSTIYEDCGSQPVSIENNKNSPHRSHQWEMKEGSLQGHDEEFSSTEDTPVDRVKIKRKRKKIKHSLRKFTDESSLFTLEL